MNDYLARRDSEWVGQVHRFLGLEVGLIQAEQEPSDRYKAYRADVTYVTNSELGFGNFLITKYLLAAYYQVVLIVHLQKWFPAGFCSDWQSTGYRTTETLVLLQITSGTILQWWVLTLAALCTVNSHSSASVTAANVFVPLPDNRFCLPICRPRRAWCCVTSTMQSLMKWIPS